MPIQVEYYDNEMTKIKSKKMVNSDGVIEGPYEEYHENGQVKERGTYKAGKKDGTSEVYTYRGMPERICIYEAGEKVEERRYGRYGCLVDVCRYEQPGGWIRGKYHREYYHSRENFGSLQDPDLRTAKIDMSDEDYWGNWRSGQKNLGRDFYDALGRCENLEVLSIGWTDIDFEAISRLKKLKYLEIVQSRGEYGSSGFGCTGEDLKRLGNLPELEYLSISAFGLEDEDMKMIHKQFPRLKYLELSYTDVGHKGAEILDADIPHFEIHGRRVRDNVSKESLAEERREQARINGLIGEGYQDKFRKAVARGDAMEAFEIMCYNGLMQRRTHHDCSRFEREKLTDTSPMWGENVLDERNMLRGVFMKDLGNGNVAFFTQYESQYWHSSVDDPNSGIEYSFSGDFSVVNPDKGVLSSSAIKLAHLGKIDFEIHDGSVSVGGVSLPVALPSDKSEQKNSAAKAKKEKASSKRKSLRKALDLTTKAKILREASAKERQMRETLTKKANAEGNPLSKAQVKVLRDAEDKARARAYKRILETRYKDKTKK